MANINGLVDGLRAQADTYVKDNDNDARLATIEAAQKLISDLETPAEFILRTFWVDCTRNAAMRLGYYLDIYNQLVASTSDKGLSSAELAKPTGADPELVSRIIRVLASTYLVTEVGPDRFCANVKTKLFTMPGFSDGIKFLVDLDSMYLTHVQLVKDLGLKSPTDNLDTTFQRALQTDKGCYDFFANVRPEVGFQFMMYMTVYRANIAKWWEPDFYPVQERLQHESLTDDTPLLVDVGGGSGHDLQKILEMHGKNLKGRLVLEDQAHVLGYAKSSGILDSRIEFAEIDLFDPQPIQGARAYHMHSILHNWPDKECHLILDKLRPAMRKGFSKLLIFDQVLPATGAKATQMAEDMLMSMFFASRERTEKQWAELLEPHGLKVTGVWAVSGGEESLVEAEIAD